MIFCRNCGKIISAYKVVTDTLFCQGNGDEEE